MTGALKSYKNASCFPPKIVCRITSGLGNQLFQYSYGRYLSKKYNYELFLDTSWFDYFQFHNPKRLFHLNNLGLRCGTEFTSGIQRILLGALSLNHPAVKKFSSTLYGMLNFTLLREGLQYSDPRLVLNGKSGRSLYLDGYWQFAQHTEETAREISHDISKNFKLSTAASMLLAELTTVNSVFVHVRRGDYLHWNISTLDMNYYKNAISSIETKISNPRYYIFTEDIEWTKANLSFIKPVTFVTFTSQNKDVEDLLLMASCKAGIIANSSYSWWAARLGDTASKIIIAPKFWWGNKESYYAQLFPINWQVL